MKKILLIIMLLFMTNPLYAIGNEQQEISTENIENIENIESINKEEYYNEIDEENDIYNNPDAVLLDSRNSKSKLNIKKRQRITNDSFSVENTENNLNISPQNFHIYQNQDIYSKKTTSYSNEKQYKNLTFGAKYDNSFTPDTFDQSRTLFTKYQKNKLSLNTSYKNSALTSFGQQFRGIFSFSPEYKINDKLSFQGIYSRNISDRSNKNEIIFTLKPFKDDRMDFNVGAGQIYYEDATPARSQFNFSTKFKF